MTIQALITACVLTIIAAPRARALPVEYALQPTTGFVLLKSCEGENGPRTSDVTLTLSSSRLEPARTLGLEIHVTLCVLFSGVIETSYSFHAFPLVDILATPLNQMRLVSLDPADVAVLQRQTGESLRPALKVEHSLQGKRHVFDLSLLGVNGADVAHLEFELSDEEARVLPGYDYQTQLPILAFSASFNGLGLSSTTRSITTIGLSRKPIPARATPRACTIWERFVSFFQGTNPNCL